MHAGLTMKVALIFPPTSDPTAPYISVPLLSACLRARGFEVLPLDANIGAYRFLLQPEVLEGLASRVRRRFYDLDQRPSLNHAEQLEYAFLGETLRSCAGVPEQVAKALDLLTGRHGDGFYQAERYFRSTAVLNKALELIGTACYPLSLSFTGYRSPFLLLSPEEIAGDAQPERNPFHEYFQEELIPRLLAERPGLIGLSVAFPGQLQPAFSLAYALRRSLPGAHLTAGGPAFTQFLLQVPEELTGAALGPFDTGVLFEGEQALADLVEALSRGAKPAGIIQGARTADLSALPPPDFDGLPLSDYLSPEPVLPYDAARGCYWGRCAFCHYGLAASGTAQYRERPAEQAAEHLLSLSEKHGCRIFYLSEDTIAPAMLLRLSGILKRNGDEETRICWATDLRAERGLSEAQCSLLRQGGALSVSLGVESGSARILELMDKGLAPRGMKSTIRALARGGIAVEVMCFSDFPTESHAEAMQSLAFLEELFQSISLFMFGEFKLTAGSRVAHHPEAYGIAELWRLRGNELQTELFYELRQPAKTEGERWRFDAALQRLSARWRLGSYPWAGSLSTAHTLLWYDRHGPDIFRNLAGKVGGAATRQLSRSRHLKPLKPGCYPLARVSRTAWRHEEEIWDALIHREREVTREAYERLASTYPPAWPARADLRKG